MTAKKIVQDALETVVGRAASAAANVLGLAPVAADWVAFRQALENGDPAAVESWARRLDLRREQVELAAVVVSEYCRLEKELGTRAEVQRQADEADAGLIGLRG